MNFLRHKRRRTPSVIIVSLIDVLLVVLIFLMVTTTFKKAQPSLKLSLPEAKAAKAGAAETQDFVVMVSTNFPFFFIGDKPVTYDQLQKELKAAAERDAKLNVKIMADKRSPVGEFIRVVDAAKAANVGGAINVVTEKGARP